MVKQPRLVMEGIYAFAPNRATMGATAYLVLDKSPAGNAKNVLIDAPTPNPDILAFILAQGGVSQWVITHRGAIGDASVFQQALQCDVCIQEQEAYLLPNIPQVIAYQSRCQLGTHLEARWTPGHSPGTSCVYDARHGGVLFTGRHLLPDQQGHLTPLRFSKTFHWPRQLRSVEALQSQFSPETLAYICPGANTGFLRGATCLSNGYDHLLAIDTARL